MGRVSISLPLFVEIRLKQLTQTRVARETRISKKARNALRGRWIGGKGVALQKKLRLEATE